MYSNGKEVLVGQKKVKNSESYVNKTVKYIGVELRVCEIKISFKDKDNGSIDYLTLRTNMFADLPE